MNLNDQPINWNGFYQAFTGVKFTVKSANCKIFVPNYKNLFHQFVPSMSATEMGFQDEFTSQSFLVDGSTEKINEVLLRDLFEYADKNILWDDFNQILSFQDIDVEKIDLAEFVKDVDTFMVYQRLAKFGNVWWSARVSTDFLEDNTKFANVKVPNISGYDVEVPQESLSFFSIDKYINDEFKKYSANPLQYSGFFTDTDFTVGGWVTVPDLKLSTKPFEKLKIAQILLDVNYTFEPGRYFGQFYTLDSAMAIRIKDLTSDVVFDVSKGRTGQNSSVYTDTLISNWIGGLTSTANLQTVGEVGNYVVDTCTEPQTSTPADTEISHAIAGQVSINVDYDPNKQSLLGTIDPINWRSTESEINRNSLGMLNVDRSFGGANGDIAGGLVFGGINKTDTNEPTILDTIEIWNGSGFSRNGQPKGNTQRSFHLQGGNSNKAAVMVGGFKNFNVTDYRQYQEYGKSGVLSSMEVYVGNADYNFSYFRKIDNFNLNTSRGDSAGALTVSVSDRQDKFAVQSSLSNYALGKDGEQTLAQFVANQSGTDNAKRYTTMSIDGIIYAGSSTGKSYLTSIDTTDSLQSFERLKTIFVDVGTSDTDLYTTTKVEVIADVMTINSAEDKGTQLNLKKCGKYRITYINGAGQVGNNANK